jgi:predicted metal-dependent hydrolase
MNQDHDQMDLLRGEPGADDGQYPLIRVSPRARRLAVRVYPDARVEVVVPPRVRPREVEHFLVQHREWIDSKRAAALARRPPPEVFPPADIQFALTQETWRLHLSGTAGRTALKEIAAATGGGILSVSGPATARLRATLRSWLLRSARARLEPRVAALAARTGVPFSRVAIRRQRSRWGSCSTRGTISINACLLFQRAEVVDYLIVHELMHVRHMNHSARFWQAVERHCPGWRALDRELLQGWRRVPRWVFSES